MRHISELPQDELTGLFLSTVDQLRQRVVSAARSHGINDDDVTQLVTDLFLNELAVVTGLGVAALELQGRGVDVGSLLRVRDAPAVRH